MTMAVDPNFPVINDMDAYHRAELHRWRNRGLLQDEAQSAKNWSCCARLIAHVRATTDPLVEVGMVKRAKAGTTQALAEIQTWPDNIEQNLSGGPEVEEQLAELPPEARAELNGWLLLARELREHPPTAEDILPTAEAIENEKFSAAKAIVEWWVHKLTRNHIRARHPRPLPESLLPPPEPDESEFSTLEHMLAYHPDIPLGVAHAVIRSFGPLVPLNLPQNHVLKRDAQGRFFVHRAA